MRFQELIFLISLFVFVPLPSFSQSSWQLDKSEDGIEVYTRDEKGSSFKSFRAVIILHASSSEIMEVLKNVDNYAIWYGFTKKAKILKEEDGVQYNYMETIFPWPYSNRDMVYSMSIDSVDIKAIGISLKGLNDYIPEKKGIVRMKKAGGCILLKSKGKETEVIYTFHSEPGDQIPAWLANRSIAELPFRTLSGLREMLEE